jgi:hypothetical protein
LKLTDVSEVRAASIMRATLVAAVQRNSYAIDMNNNNKVNQEYKDKNWWKFQGNSL